MVRSAAAVRALRRAPTAESALVAERALRKLVDENRRLRRELSELRKLERWVGEDPLTGLATRRLFDERLSEELTRAFHDPDHVGAVLVAELSAPRAGGGRTRPSLGDEAIRATAQLLRGAVRPGDVCCRTGEQVFMILLPELDAAGARIVANRLRASLFREGARRDLALSLDIGTASWPADGVRPARLIAAAERARRAQKLRLRRGGARRANGSGLALVKPLVK